MNINKEGTRFSRDGVDYEIKSIGGEYTYIYCKWAKRGTENAILIDCGGLPDDPRVLNLRHVFLTHCHMDHFQRITSLLHDNVNIYVPAEKAKELEDYIEMYSTVTASYPRGKVIPMSPGTEILIAKKFKITAFKTFHTTPSNGYIISRLTTKIKPEYANCTSAEKKELGMKGIKLSESFYDSLSAMTGDTSYETLIANPELLSIKTLMMECTFIDDEKEPEWMYKKGHVHLDSLNKFTFENKTLVFYHFSGRYTQKQIRSIVPSKFHHDDLILACDIHNNE